MFLIRQFLASVLFSSFHQLTADKCSLQKLLMVGFKPGSSGVRNDHSATSVTATVSYGITSHRFSYQMIWQLLGAFWKTTFKVKIAVAASWATFGKIGFPLIAMFGYTNHMLSTTVPITYKQFV